MVIRTLHGEPNKNDFLKADRTEGGIFGRWKKFSSWKIYGYSGNDTLIGGDKADTLDGGIGADRMEGGDGDDFYIIDDPNDVIVERTGFDRVLSKISYTILANGIEQIDVDEINFGTDVIVGGNDLNNKMYGTDTENDYMYGSDGNDLIAGFAGNDTLIGGDDHDILHGWGGNDDLYGGSGSDFLRGDEGNDMLSGGTKSQLDFYELDTLTGGSGADTFVLGDRGGKYHIDNPSSSGNNYFSEATITDFEIFTDRLQLHGSSSDYVTTETVSKAHLYDNNNDLIATFNGVSENSLDFVLENYTDYV